jgi:hypothetical protein
MEGITILATEIVTLGIPFWVAIIGGLGLLCAVFVITWTISKDFDASDYGFAAFIGVLVMFIFVLICVGTYKEETHYLMTIDETVSIVEFNKQYEIVDQKGEIYIVREKEGNKDD